MPHAVFFIDTWQCFNIYIKYKVIKYDNIYLNNNNNNIIIIIIVKPYKQVYVKYGIQKFNKITFVGLLRLANTLTVVELTASMCNFFCNFMIAGKLNLYRSILISVIVSLYTGKILGFLDAGHK